MDLDPKGEQALVIAPIVEGHGEEQGAFREVVSRIGFELLAGAYFEILRPIRHPKSQLTTASGLRRAVGLARLKLREKATGRRSMVLILLDADHDLPCDLGPGIQALARQSHADLDVSCVIANVEFETWFIAAASSLETHLELSDGEPPEDPEEKRLGKGWIKDRFRGTSYSETIDQPKLAARMDLELCRERSPSFDKLCRELEARVPP